MKVIILNSGIGKRLGDITNNKPKCLVELINNKSILEIQLDILKKFDLKEIIITTGPFEDSLKELCSVKFPEMNFTFFNNSKYSSTNYIYSMYLMDNNILDDEILLLHGDLVFEDCIIKKIISERSGNFAFVNKVKPLPEKDFKAKISKNIITKISVDFKDEIENIFTFMPLYKFTKNDFSLWMNKIAEFIHSGNLNCYAENALNEILEDTLTLQYVEYNNEFLMEIDDINDLKIANDFYK